VFVLGATTYAGGRCWPISLELTTAALKKQENICFENKFWSADSGQGCQMAYSQTKNPNFGKFWRVLKRKMLVIFTVVWSTLLLFGILCSNLVYFMFIWYIFFPILVCCTKKIWQPWFWTRFFCRLKREGRGQGAGVAEVKLKFCKNIDRNPRYTIMTMLANKKWAFKDQPAGQRPKKNIFAKKIGKNNGGFCSNYC
jgi:hypothetical protein